MLKADCQNNQSYGKHKIVSGLQKKSLFLSKIVFKT